MKLKMKYLMDYRCTTVDIGNEGKVIVKVK